MVLCCHRPSGRHFALKILPKKEILKSRSAARTLTEKEALQNLCGHPRIVKFYATIEDADCIYFLFGVVGGGELYRLIRFAPILSSRACIIASEIVCALKFIHNRGYVYRFAYL